MTKHGHPGTYWARRRSCRATGTLLVSTGTATAHTEAGHAEGSGSTVLYSFDFHAYRDFDGRPGGYFEAKATSPADALSAPRGPVTCVEIQGNRVGFLYSIEDGAPVDLLFKDYVEMITAQDNGPGHSDIIGILGPAPAAAFPNCHPSLAYLLVDGDISVHKDAGSITGG